MAYHDSKDWQYHEDWNWLMSVVEKIRSLEEVENIDINIGCDCIIDILGVKESIHVYCDNSINTLNAVYLAVVEFIKYYNDRQRNIKKSNEAH